MKKHGKIDNNQKEIVRQLREMGFNAHSIASLGDGFPDLLIGHLGFNILIELKNPEYSPKKEYDPFDLLTDDEKKWHSSYMGQVDICETLEDCVKVIYRVVNDS